MTTLAQLTPYRAQNTKFRNHTHEFHFIGPESETRTKLHLLGRHLHQAAHQGRVTVCGVPPRSLPVQTTTKCAFSGREEQELFFQICHRSLCSNHLRRWTDDDQLLIVWVRPSFLTRNDPSRVQQLIVSRFQQTCHCRFSVELSFRKGVRSRGDVR